MNLDKFDKDELLALIKIDTEAKRLDKALEKTKALLTLENLSQDTFLSAGRLYAQLGLFEKAKRYFELAIEGRPEAIHETFELGMVCADAGHRETAMNHWDQVLKLNPKHPPTLFYTALALEEAGQHNLARERLEDLLEATISSNLYHEKARQALTRISDAAKKTMLDDGTLPTVKH